MRQSEQNYCGVADPARHIPKAPPPCSGICCHSRKFTPQISLVDTACQNRVALHPTRTTTRVNHAWRRMQERQSIRSNASMHAICHSQRRWRETCRALRTEERLIRNSHHERGRRSLYILDASSYYIPAIFALHRSAVHFNVMTNPFLRHSINWHRRTVAAGCEVHNNFHMTVRRAHRRFSLLYLERSSLSQHDGNVLRPPLIGSHDSSVFCAKWKRFAPAYS